MGNKIKIITVQNIEIAVVTNHENDYVCITDIAKSKEGDSRAADVIKNWIRNRTTLEFIGTWEQMYNPDFKVVEFDHFKMQAGLPSFVLSPEHWVEKTNAIGIYVKLGKYGGTFAHKDIAFEFCSAISPVFKLFLIKEFQRLKDDENSRLKLEWNLQRTLAKVNYRIHTDAIKEKIIPQKVTKNQQPYITLVDQILSAKKSDPQANTSALEQQIDNMVYKLYELTYNEVKVIDPEYTLTEEEYAAIKVL